jgi:hypothetical protein
MTHTLVFEEKLQNNCKEERHVPKSSLVQEEKNTISLIKQQQM